MREINFSDLIESLFSGGFSGDEEISIDELITKYAPKMAGYSPTAKIEEGDEVFADFLEELKPAHLALAGITDEIRAIQEGAKNGKHECCILCTWATIDDLRDKATILHNHIGAKVKELFPNEPRVKLVEGWKLARFQSEPMRGCPFLLARGDYIEVKPGDEGYDEFMALIEKMRKKNT